MTADEKANMVVMRDSPETVRLAERLVAAHDVTDSEVMLDVEVLEVSRTRLSKLGLVAPESVSIGNPTTTGGIILGAAGIRAAIANPALIVNLKDRDSAADLLANPRIRVKNRTKARIHIGEKLPVVTTTATANVGVSSSVSYLDVGLKLDVEPTIHLNDEVSIGLKLEVSNLTDTIRLPAAGGSETIAYRLGTRNTETTLRLKDGETQILAGLIQNDQRRSRTKIPVLGDLPLIGRLFSSDDGDGNARSKTEVVLLITPRILRAIEVPLPEMARFPAGMAGDNRAVPVVMEGEVVDPLLGVPAGENPPAANEPPPPAAAEQEAAKPPARRGDMSFPQR
ncbi:MAG: type II and III secretion system protein [Rhodocyclaceae bacterium]|nr:type II and III secretion system protein [Rhodocyclaceae bacterium]